MLLDDRRHGTVAGFLAHRKEGEKACDACREGWLRYEKLRRFRHARGVPAYVPARGAKRRIQALASIGWSMKALDAELGRKTTYTSNLLNGPDEILATTAAEVAAVYERLCMSRPEGWVADRARRQAAARGWVPPLSWDNIDLDADHKIGDVTDHFAEPVIDEALVIRVIETQESDICKIASPAERAEIARRWAGAGRPLNDLARLTGWKVERYFKASA